MAAIVTLRARLGTNNAWGERCRRRGGGGAFLAAAQQGMFAVDTASAEKMVTAIEQIRARLNDQLRRIEYLKAKDKLGNLPEADAIEARNRLVASGDEQSLAFVLQRFAEALQEAQQALEIGIRNYAQIETQAEQDLRRIGHG
jgi:hypothetical protein